MSITAECTACGRRYEAPASMAGKRVRCKQCGNIFALPDASLEEGPDLDALAAVEQSFHSVDATDAGGSAVREGEDDDDSGESVAPLRSGRRNVRFSFPLAGELDLWLPRVLLFGGLAWLVWFCIKRDNSGVAWMPYVRLAAALIAFFVFVAPITHIMIRKAGKQLGYQMPTGDKFRSYASYLPAFALGYALWVGGGGRLSGLILGCVAGVALATLFLWLFFRLAPSEIAPSALYALVGFFVGLGIVGAIYFGINALILQAMVSMKNPDLLPASPFGPSGGDSALTWLSDDERARLRAEKDKEAKPAPPPVVTSPVPAPVGDPPAGPEQTLPAIVRSMQTAAVGPFDEIIRPLTDSNFRATTRQSGRQIAIQVWNIDTMRQLGATSFSLNEAWENKFILSPDGNLVARAGQFPSLSVQMYSFSAQGVTDRLPLTAPPGAPPPELIGFVDNRRLLVRWQVPTGSIIEVRDITAPQNIRRVELPQFEHTGTTLVFSRDASLAAVATKTVRTGSTTPAPTLLIYSLETGQKTVDATIESLDARWPVTPTGMAFSPDSKRLALLFEQGGNGLLIYYEITDQGQARRLSDHVYPAGPIFNRGAGQFFGNALQPVPDGKSWLLYGHSIFTSARSQPLGELEVPGVEAAWTSSVDRAELIVRGPDGQRQYRVLRLELNRIGTMVGQ